jgi:hypothetical protein
MRDVAASLWKLQCKNEKCNRFFDYYGRSGSMKAISCTNCGKSLQYRVGEFARHGPAVGDGRVLPR